MSKPISDEVRLRVQRAFNYCCACCLSAQRYVLGILEIDHIIPISSNGTDDEENLCLACRLCNGYKARQTSGIDPITHHLVALFNPRQQSWGEHFQ